MYNNRPHLDWKYNQTYVHTQEKEIADLLKEHDLKFTYRQPTYLYHSDHRPAIASPSFTIHSLGKLIVDYSPLKNTFDMDYKQKMYDQNNLDAIVVNKTSFEYKNWPHDLYNDIASRLNRYG